MSILKLSDAVVLTKSKARGEGISYPVAACKALQSMGFQKPREVTVSVARIVNDIEADEHATLLKAVTKQCAYDRWYSPRRYFGRPSGTTKRKIPDRKHPATSTQGEPAEPQQKEFAFS